jgi:hypothetical protein
MQKDHILKFLEHIFGRQEQFGVEDAFRFRIYIKKKTEQPAKYDRRPPAGNKNSKTSKAMESSSLGKSSNATVKVSAVQKEVGEGSNSQNEMDDTIEDASAEEAEKNLRAAIAEQKVKFAAIGTVEENVLNEETSCKHGESGVNTAAAVDLAAAGGHAAPKVFLPDPDNNPPEELVATPMERIKKGKEKQRKKEVTKAEEKNNLEAKKKLRSHLKLRK